MLVGRLRVRHEGQGHVAGGMAVCDATVVVVLAFVGQSRLGHGCSKKALTRRRAITFAPLKSSNEVET